MRADGSRAVVYVLLLHLTQTFLYGAYKGRCEVLWISGCALFGLMLAMAFTGYLLPWDQKAYFATTVGTNMASAVPLIGSALKRLMRGGNAMGTLTLSRVFVAHVFRVPAAIVGLLADPVYLLRTAGAAGPPSPVRPARGPTAGDPSAASARGLPLGVAAGSCSGASAISCTLRSALKRGISSAARCSICAR